MMMSTTLPSSSSMDPSGLILSAHSKADRAVIDFRDQFIRLRPAGGFSLIMADPAWRSEMRSEAGLKKSPEAHYQTMETAEICAMPVEILAAQDCLLWLWARGSQIQSAIAVVEAWGFALKTMGWWAKVTPKGKQTFGTGYILRNAGEPYLIATRGAPRTRKSVRDTIIGVRREHSRKPEEAYAAAETLMPDVQRLDLFSRTNRAGWSSWGAETGKFNVASRSAQP